MWPRGYAFVLAVAVSPVAWFLLFMSAVGLIVVTGRLKQASGPGTSDEKKRPSDELRVEFTSHINRVANSIRDDLASLNNRLVAHVAEIGPKIESATAVTGAVARLAFLEPLRDQFVMSSQQVGLAFNKITPDGINKTGDIIISDEWRKAIAACRGLVQRAFPDRDLVTTSRSMEVEWAAIPGDGAITDLRAQRAYRIWHLTQNELLPLLEKEAVHFEQEIKRLNAIVKSAGSKATN
jgi:hypothetical protein